MKKIYVWGNGGGTARLFRDKRLKVGDVCGFIVSRKESGDLEEFMGKPVVLSSEMAEKEYDAIIVGSVYVENICRECKQYGIDLKKVIFMYRNIAAREDNFNYGLCEEIFGTDFTRFIAETNYVINGSAIEYCDDPKKYGYRHEGTFGTDFVRFRTFEMLCQEIKSNGVQGSVAELGVFRGNFTYYINRELGDRKTYLFDTFGGFGENDIKKDTESGFLHASVAEAYTNTNVGVVREKLAHPENVEFRVGYFPESLHGLEDKFAFVLIDVDLEDPIYNGLSYFVPRMLGGGYIMLHDYNNYLGGVKRSVIRYESESGIKLKKVPLCDDAGTLVLCF